MIGYYPLELHPVPGSERWLERVIKQKGKRRDETGRLTGLGMILSVCFEVHAKSCISSDRGLALDPGAGSPEIL